MHKYDNNEIIDIICTNIYKYLHVFLSILYCNASYTFVNWDTELLVYHIYTKNKNIFHFRLSYFLFSVQ